MENEHIILNGSDRAGGGRASVPCESGNEERMAMSEAETKGIAALCLGDAEGDLRTVFSSGAPIGDPEKGDWAHDLCALTREVHVEVWEWCPSPEHVEEFIRLFGQVEEAIGRVPESKVHPTKKYAGNVAARIRNLGRYVNGQESAFAPNDPNPA